jgi:hypothetical protein
MTTTLESLRLFVRETLADVLGEPVRTEPSHSRRFRRVSTRYPRHVADAYGGDLAAAAAASEEEVAARVAEWEREHGIEPRDWYAIGQNERDEED